MGLVRKLEQTMVQWFRGAPHLPKSGQQWIAENVWWVVLIVVIIGIFSLFSLFGALTALTAVTGSAYSMYAAAYAPYGDNVGMAILSIWVSLAALAVSVVLMALAISPLKAQSKKGWNLLFISQIIYFVFGIVTALVSLNFTGVLGPIVGAIIGFYFIFEIREYFAGTKNVKANHTKPTTVKAKN